MKIRNFKLPENYVSVFKRAQKELLGAKSKIIYIYSPPGYGKTTTLIKFFEDTKFFPVFIQIEDKDRDVEIFKVSLLKVLSYFSESLKRTISLMDEREILRSFWNILEIEYRNIFLPKNTYFIFLDAYYLMENFGKIIREIILPVFDNLPARIIIEGNFPYEFEGDLKIIGADFFTLTTEEIIEMANFFDKKIDYEDASLLKEKTGGWILLSLWFLKDERNIKTKINSLSNSSEILDEFIEKIFKYSNEEEKILLLGIAQLKEFNYDLIRQILGFENPGRLINKLKEKGFVFIEEIKEGILTFHFHPVLKSYLERKLKSFPGGYNLILRIYMSALEYLEKIENFEDAIYYAIKMRDSAKCGEYLKKILIKVFNEGKVHLIEVFLKEIEDEGIARTPEIMFCKGVYLNLIEKYKESVKILKGIAENLKGEDLLISKYFILIGRSYLNEREDILIEEGNRLLEELKKYEGMHKFPIQFIYLMYDRIYNFLGNRYYSKKEIGKAKEFYEKSLFFSKKREDDRSILISLHNIGTSLLFDGKKEAINYFLEVTNYPSSFPIKAVSLNNIGVYYEMLEGNLEKAEEYYKKSIEICEKFFQYYEINTPLTNLIYLYLKKKNKEKIFAYLEKLKKFAFETGNQRIIDSFYLNKANVLLHLGEIKEAEKSLEKISKNGDSKFEEDRYYKMYVEGKLRYLEGKITKAKRMINESIEWFLLKDSFSNKIEKIYYIYEIYKEFNDSEIIRIRKIAENLLREKGCLGRLKDFDIK